MNRMQAEIDAARKKKADEAEHSAAKAAADAEVIAAATPTMEQSFAAQEVAMRVANEKMAREQEETLSAAQSLSREADAAVFLAFAAVLSIAAEDRGLFKFAVCVACAGLVRFVVPFDA